MEDETWRLGLYAAISNRVFGEGIDFRTEMIPHARFYYLKMIYCDGFRYQELVREIMPDFDHCVIYGPYGRYYEAFFKMNKHLIAQQMLRDIKEIIDFSGITNPDVDTQVEDLQKQKLIDIDQVKDFAKTLGLSFDDKSICEEIVQEIREETPEIYEQQLRDIIKKYKANHNHI